MSFDTLEHCLVCVGLLYTCHLYVNYFHVKYRINMWSIFVFFSSCQEERDKWLEDLQGAINYAKDHEEDSKILYPSLKSNSKS